MTAKQKAEEMFNEMSKQTYRYQPYAGANWVTDEIGQEAGKKCALIMVREILNTLFQLHQIDYWKEVKVELEAL